MNMVKKLIALLSGENWPSTGKLSDNRSLFHLLEQYRGLIGDAYTSKKWDRHKKLANPYELIYTMFHSHPSICKHVPISRSFFKLWEILHDLKEDMPFLAFTEHTLKATFLAEAPGGFMEAFMRWRPTSPDKLCGMTLISEDTTVPRWKSTCANQWVPGYPGQVLFERGLDGTGSLYNLDNIATLVDKMGHHQSDLVTADGGFDFSKDFNSQENMSSNLVACEIYAALQLQAQGGAFVLKIYDINTPLTFQLLWILKLCYEKLYIYKPLTSRPANSEKYVVCCGFHSVHVSLLDMLKGICQGRHTTDLLIAPPLGFMQAVVHANHYFVMRQIVNINHTLMLIKKERTSLKDKTLLNRQLTKAIRWCHKYGLEINVEALRQYQIMLQ